MSLTAWLSIVFVCAAGAMSPGPSLAVVIRNTLHGDRTEGIKTGVSHAIGIVFYAFITATGIGVLVTQSPTIFTVIKYAGALFLLWLAYSSLTQKTSAAAALDSSSEMDPKDEKINAVRDGLLISLLNPKIILFFLALFSQFVSPEAGWKEISMVSATAGVIDAAWYIFVALFVSQASVILFLRRRIGLINKVFGVLLVAVALRVLV